MEQGTVHAILGYLQSHPLLAVALVAVAAVMLFSLLRKLLKLAVILAVVLLVGLYWTHREAAGEWRAKAEALGRRAAAVGRGAVKVGRILLDEDRKEADRAEGQQADKAKAEELMQQLVEQ